MEHEFDKRYWDDHWQQAPADPTFARANPYLVREVGDLVPGTALEAGCGEGAEAIWLGLAGWKVTAVDVADEALARAAGHAAALGLVGGEVRWVRADLSSWETPDTFDLVTTHYAHPSSSQLELYDRLAAWVAPGGTLLIVGHLHNDHAEPGASHDHEPPPEAGVTAAAVTARLDLGAWDVVTAAEHTRTVEAPGGGQVTLHDVVVRAQRRTAQG